MFDDFDLQIQSDELAWQYEMEFEYEQEQQKEEIRQENF